MAAKSLEVYAVRTITFDHTTGVELMRCGMQLAAECLQVLWWEVRDANYVPAHQAHQQEALGKGSERAGVFESVCIPNVRTKR